MKNQSEAEEAKLVKPIVKWCAERGRKAQFIAALRTLAKEDVRADRVYEWLRDNEQERTSPPYGWGVLMRKTAQLLKIPVE